MLAAIGIAVIENRDQLQLEKNPWNETGFTRVSLDRQALLRADQCSRRRSRRHEEAQAASIAPGGFAFDNDMAEEAAVGRDHEGLQGVQRRQNALAAEAEQAAQVPCKEAAVEHVEQPRMPVMPPQCAQMPHCRCHRCHTDATHVTPTLPTAMGMPIACPPPHAPFAAVSPLPMAPYGYAWA